MGCAGQSLRIWEHVWEQWYEDFSFLELIDAYPFLAVKSSGWSPAVARLDLCAVAEGLLLSLKIFTCIFFFFLVW